MSSHSLLRRIFLTQGLNLGVLHCRQNLYHLCHQGIPIWKSLFWGLFLYVFNFPLRYMIYTAKHTNQKWIIWWLITKLTHSCNFHKCQEIKLCRHFRSSTQAPANHYPVYPLKISPPCWFLTWEIGFTWFLGYNKGTMQYSFLWTWSVSLNIILWDWSSNSFI